MAVLEETLLVSTLLIVELALLILTVYLLVLTFRETKHREALIDRLITATRTFTRAEYFTIVQEAIGEATQYVYASVTGTKPEDEEEKNNVGRILTNISRASKIGVDIRILLPRDPSRLYMGYMYTNAGAKVKFNKSLLVNELRYMIVDGNTVILGVPEKRGVEEPTRKGHRIYSEGFALILKERFENIWNSSTSISYKDYVQEVIDDITRETPGVSIDYICSVTRLPREEVVAIAHRG
ncbi:MAG TPA: hypothetical protein EYH45_01205 [Candidatus Caldiarchaeum subterraneum]|uniref:Uncharacterized protein n=1 Tax=Caldiarchaeum subterraneum TaxID=311458 RepID=A0A832ZXJ2_CALS0|nr:hypothetical protein [Candidatus Caldarchaeum subterraneum]